MTARTKTPPYKDSTRTGNGLLDVCEHKESKCSKTEIYHCVAFHENIFEMYEMSLRSDFFPSRGNIHYYTLCTSPHV